MFKYFFKPITIDKIIKIKSKPKPYNKSKFSRRVLMGQAEIFKELETKYKDDVEY